MNLNKIKELIETTSLNLKLNYSFVEKDFYAVTLLKGIVECADNVVFKGGTCLSKCFKIINRFSEDIDISVIEEHLTIGQRKKISHVIIENAIEKAGLTLENPETIRSRRDFNRYICNYDSNYFNENLKANVILELALMSPCFPYEIKKIQTIIGEYLESIGRLDLVEEFDLKAFDVKVQKLERTFIDKVFALCDYQISKKLTRQSRHIYDLNKIFSLINFDDEFLKLFDEVKKYRIDNPTCYSAKEGQKLYKIFNDLIREETFLQDYNNATKPLLYDNVSYKECEKTLKLIQNYLEREDL